LEPRNAHSGPSRAAVRAWAASQLTNAHRARCMAISIQGHRLGRVVHIRDQGRLLSSRRAITVAVLRPPHAAGRADPCAPTLKHSGWSLSGSRTAISPDCAASRSWPQAPGSAPADSHPARLGVLAPAVRFLRLRAALGASAAEVVGTARDYVSVGEQRDPRQHLRPHRALHGLLQVADDLADADGYSRRGPRSTAATGR